MSKLAINTRVHSSSERAKAVVKESTAISKFHADRNVARLLLLVALAVCFGNLCGCSSGGNNSSAAVIPALPTPPVPTLTNNYVGTQGPGLWSYTIDNTQNAFIYQPLTYPASPNVSDSGKFVSVSGFMTLAGQTSAPAGYSLEIPSRVALLRPGNNTKNLVAAVQQLNCFPLGGNVKFQFVALVDNGNITVTTSTGAYGSFFANTTPDGTSWQFGGQALYGLPGTGELPPGPLVPGYPSSFAGTCTENNGQASIAVPALSAGSYSTPPTTLQIGPTGFLIEDQSTSKSQNGGTSMVGVVQPSAPLVAANIVAGKYLGFMYTSLSGKTQPIGFGQIVAGAGTSMTGGVFPNDDVTQLQNSDTILTLGTQDPANNGLYSSATITEPDPQYTCPSAIQSGVDAFGNPTCTLEAIAVVGNPENKFAIFVVAETLGGTTGIYLFQQ